MRYALVQESGLGLFPGHKSFELAPYTTRGGEGRQVPEEEEGGRQVPEEEEGGRQVPEEDEGGR